MANLSPGESLALLLTLPGRRNVSRSAAVVMASVTLFFAVSAPALSRLVQATVVA